MEMAIVYYNMWDNIYSLKYYAKEYKTLGPGGCLFQLFISRLKTSFPSVKLSCTDARNRSLQL